MVNWQYVKLFEVGKETPLADFCGIDVRVHEIKTEESPQGEGQPKSLGILIRCLEVERPCGDVDVFQKWHVPRSIKNIICRYLMVIDGDCVIIRPYLIIFVHFGVEAGHVPHSRQRVVQPSQGVRPMCLALLAHGETLPTK